MHPAKPIKTIKSVKEILEDFQKFLDDLKARAKKENLSSEHCLKLANAEHDKAVEHLGDLHDAEVTTSKDHEIAIAKTHSMIAPLKAETKKDADSVEIITNKK